MVIYNDIIPFKGYDSMVFFPFIFARVKPLDSVVLNHEKVHLCQQLEVLVASLLVILVLVIAFGVSFWWLFAAFAVYYLFYGIEYGVRFLMYRDRKEAYKNISFEQEAYANDGDLDYLKGRGLFAWVEFLTTKTYRKVV